MEGYLGCVRGTSHIHYYWTVLEYHASSIGRARSMDLLRFVKTAILSCTLLRRNNAHDSHRDESRLPGGRRRRPALRRQQAVGLGQQLEGCEVSTPRGPGLEVRLGRSSLEMRLELLLLELESEMRLEPAVEHLDLGLDVDDTGLEAVRREQLSGPGADGLRELHRGRA